MSMIFTRNFCMRWGELDASHTFSPENYLDSLVETACGAAGGVPAMIFMVITGTATGFLFGKTGSHGVIQPNL